MWVVESLFGVLVVVWFVGSVGRWIDKWVEDLDKFVGGWVGGGLGGWVVWGIGWSLKGRQSKLSTHGPASS